MKLSYEEAEFLRNRVIRSNPHSLWALILKEHREVVEENKMDTFTDLLRLPFADEGLRRDMHIAEQFAFLIDGAQRSAYCMISMKALEGLRRQCCNQMKINNIRNHLLQ